MIRVFCFLAYAGASLLTPSLLRAQCADGTDWVYGTNYTDRQDGNHDYSYTSTYAVGDYAAYWQPYVTVNYYYNSVLEAQGTYTANPLSTASFSETALLQAAGPGTAQLNGFHQVYAAACNSWEPPYANDWSGYTSSSLTVSRPARPSYSAGYVTSLWYLGPGISSNGQYSATTMLTPGQANGAPESPVYMISSGGTELQLSCTACSNPTATAIKSSSRCQVYDVVVNTSYNGFLSDPFYLFINRPWNTVAAIDPRNGQWVYSAAMFNGYLSYINYKTQGLCATDPPMSNYSLNESFTGHIAPVYGGENWPGLPDPGHITLPAGYSQWADQVGAYNPNAPAKSLAICDNGFACVPQWTAPGVGPHQLVLTVPQSWWVGSVNSGDGARVQSDVVEDYIDSGWHTSIVTPNA